MGAEFWVALKMKNKSMRQECEVARPRLRHSKAACLGFAVLWAMALSGCLNKNRGSAQAVMVPWPQADRSYAITRVELTTLTDPDHLSGGVARFWAESTLTSSGFSGRPMSAKFLRRSDGTLVPKDIFTLQGATIYAHLERLYAMSAQLSERLRELDPIKVGLQLQLTESGGGGGGLFNNAYYYGSSNSLAFVPPAGKSLAIDYNAGAIAHEYFHSLFHLLVVRELEPLVSRPVAVRGVSDFADAATSASESQKTASFSCLDVDKAMSFSGPGAKAAAPVALGVSEQAQIEEFNLYVLRAFNEGLADFWGWVYTDDPRFLHPSYLGGQQGFRELSVTAKPFPSHSFYVSAVQALAKFSRAPLLKAPCFAYLMGSSAANVLFNLAVARSGELERAQIRSAQPSAAAQPVSVPQEQRWQMAKQVLLALPRVREWAAGRISKQIIFIDELVGITLKNLAASDAATLETEEALGCEVMSRHQAQSRARIMNCSGEQK